MSTYRELLAQKAALDKQTAELERQLHDARRAERAGVVGHIKQLMLQNGLTLEDLNLKPGASGASKVRHPHAAKPVAPKYRDPATGSTWSGRGLQPKWVKAAQAAGKTLEDLKV